MPAIEALGHVGIYAEDIIKMRDFYSNVIGLKIADQDLDGRGMVFMSADPKREHHEFVLVKGRVTNDDARVIQQISFIVNSVEDLKDYYYRLKEENVTIDRTVSHGNALGMYFFDPEGNRIELYYRTGFDVPQPHGDPINMEDSVEELLGIAKAAIPA
ncbi:MAG: hypothetical protein BZY88_17840 [SAR202 cluster bacterium Io17-Chloro-G9]|nr:MAG: hypothetical protein BZY88_17840 [SAR202 cluster bacterium Io17-Chloro-G9]